MITRIFFLALSLCLCFNLSAQATERAKKRAEQRAEQRANQRVDQKVDQAVDEAFDAIGSLFKKKKTDKTENKEATDKSEADNSASILSGIMGGGEWEAYTNDVTFSLVMDMTETKKNGKEEHMSMQMGALPEAFAIIVHDEDEGMVSQMILDTQSGKTTMVTTDNKGKKAGYRMRMPRLKSTMQEAGESIEENYTFTKTGERKTIDGYDCEKIIVKDNKEGTTTTSWVTQDLDISAYEIFSSIAGMTGAGKQKGPNPMAAPFEGFPILSITDDGKSTYEMHYKNIKTGSNIDRSLFDVSGVEIQEVGF